LLHQELFQFVATPLNRKVMSPLDTSTNYLEEYGFWSMPYRKGQMQLSG